jgi:ABC-type nitrate/sulfonate/bicarbonate transport system ATPase subunit
MADFRLDNVAKRFGEVQAVSGLSLEAASGEFIVLLGPSGAGKTTTLRLVAGLETPDQGRVHIGGDDVTATAPALRDVTFVFQQYSLYPHLSVFDNLAFPLRSPLRRIPETQVREKVNEVARMLRIDDKLASPATKLSGGQMQRVAIGRALVRNPAVTLMDEPLSSLDAKLRNDLRLELRRIQQDLGATMLYVTHDQTEALTLATRIGVSITATSCRWARRARSTRTRRPVWSPLASVRRASTSCRAQRCANSPHPMAPQRSACAPRTCTCTATACGRRTACARRCGVSKSSATSDSCIWRWPMARMSSSARRRRAVVSSRAARYGSSSSGLSGSMTRAGALARGAEDG